MPNFNYIRNIPSAPHNPSVDQPDMQINTNSTDDILDVNHYGFNDNNGGYHKRADLVNQSAPYNTPAGVGSVLISSFNEWIFTNASLSGAGIQMTTSTAPPISLPRGSTFLPGGMVMQWGQGITDGAGSFNDTLVYNLSSVYCYQASTGNIPGTITTPIIIGSNVTVFARNTSNSPVSGAQVSWFAIGIL